MGNRWFGSVVAGLVVVSAPTVPGLSRQPPHNVVLFVADGLRPGMVNDQTAPALAALMKNGVHFTNTHSMFPRTRPIPLRTFGSSAFSMSPHRERNFPISPPSTRQA
jgi:hypothetical protein